MGWKTEYLRDLDIIEITTDGVFNANNLREIVKSTLDLVEKHQTTAILGNCVNLIHSNTVFNIYEFPAILESMQVDRRLKQAMLPPPNADSRKNIEFYETVSLNRGYIVRVFDDRDKAVQWLHE